jgi:hypothetical protein
VAGGWPGFARAAGVSGNGIDEGEEVSAPAVGSIALGLRMIE